MACFSIYRYDIVAADDGALGFELAPILVARASPNPRLTVDDRVTFTDAAGSHTVTSMGAYGLACFASPIRASGALTTAGTPRADPTVVHAELSTYDLALVNLGLPAWLPPMPTQAMVPGIPCQVECLFGSTVQSGTAVAGADGTVTHRFPALALPGGTFLTYKAENVVVTATGNGTIETRLDPVSGLPAASTSTWHFDMECGVRIDGRPIMAPYIANVLVRQDVRPFTMPPTALGDDAALARALLVAHGAAIGDLVADPSTRLADAPAWAAGSVSGAAFAALHLAAHPDGLLRQTVLIDGQRPDRSDPGTTPADPAPPADF